jgi:hypothetical protein
MPSDASCVDQNAAVMDYQSGSSMCKTILLYRQSMIIIIISPDKSIISHDKSIISPDDDRYVSLLLSLLLTWPLCGSGRREHSVPYQGTFSTISGNVQ